MNIEKAIRIVEEYRALLARSIIITENHPDFYASVDDDSATLWFEGEDAVIEWTEVESDYDGGLLRTRESTRFPARILFLSDDAIAQEIRAAKLRIDEQNAQRAAEREQQARDAAEYRDIQEFERLKAKFGVGR